MIFNNKQHLKVQQLKENMELLDQSIISLQFSQTQCQKFFPKESYTQEEFEHLEAFTARFARTVDIYTQKVLKTFFILLGENIITFLDAANFVEKLALVEKADDLVSLRILRNEISHEYVSEKLDEVFSETISSLPPLYSYIL
jgi:hypothetical protein